MTERPERRRLTAVVLLTPAAAALLAGSLAWASGNPPEVALKQSSAVPAATSSTGDSADAELRERIRAVERLRKQVASLRAELKRLEGGKGDSTSTGSSSSQSGASSGGGTATTKPATKPKPKPTRTVAPPPVDANTGAS